MTEEQFYDLWAKFANSNIATELPDDVEEFCSANEILIDYFIQEFL